MQFVILNITTHLYEVEIVNECFDESDLTEGWDKYLEINPYDVNAWNGKGECLLYVYELSEAMECFERALSIDPNSSRSLTNKGHTLLEMGEFYEAIDYFDKALLIDPSDGFAMLYRGISFYSITNYEEAIDCYNKALILEPVGEISTIWYKMGLTFFELDEYEKSVNSFDMALDFEFKKLNSDPNNIDEVCSLLHEKARSLLFLKKTDDALQCSEMMLKLQPENSEALKIKDLCLKKLSRNSSL
jgi:tetratricopeptide (TPR) repeat protein